MTATQRHEIPTHLNVPDRFLLGLTAKQAMQLIGAASGAYGLLDQHALPFEVRVGLAILSVVMGVLLALVRPGGCAIEEWGLLALVHAATPREMVWRPSAAAESSADGAWAALAPRVGWLVSAAEEARHVAR